MSFSASTCITNTGTSQLGPTLFFYSDTNGFQSSFGSAPTLSLTGENCPYIMENIPDGTTIVRIIDPTTNCCLDINLESSDLCNICNLDFDVYETQTVSEIVAGNLIGSCDDNISDYIINWYGPGEGSTNLAFTSGYGTEFQDIGWDWTHPLTGSQSPLVEAGIYTPVIDRVIVNGTAFSLTGAPNTYIANLNCFTSALVTVDAIKCDNGNLPQGPGSIYSHFFQFNNVSVGNPPIGLSATFALSSTTNYIAWQFRGYERYDTLKMTFYGSAYNYIPLIIENVKIGFDAGPINVVFSSNPKQIPDSDFVRKVTCLTAFTINEGDYITINITPNNVTNNTTWDFYLKCLESFDCSTCYDQFANSFAKIISGGTFANENECSTEIILPVSACTQSDYYQTDTGKYLNNNDTKNSQMFNSGSEVGPLYYNLIECNQVNRLYSDTFCSTSSNNSYSFEKSIVDGQGFISFSFESLSDLNYYITSYQSVINEINTYAGGSSYDNTQINYYRTFNLRVPYDTNPDLECGDTSQPKIYTIHHTSVVTSSTTYPYTMTITMPTIDVGIEFSNCDLNCSTRVNFTKNAVNSSSLSSQNNIQLTTNTSSKYLNPFYHCKIITSENSSDIQEGVIGFLATYWTFENDTYVYSGNNSLVTSLTGRTCENKGTPESSGSPGTGARFRLYSHKYLVQLTDPNNLTSFQVFAADVSNYLVPENIYPNLAMTVVNNVVTYANPDYCI